MIIGSGWHNSADADGIDTGALRDLAAEEHPHPLLAAADAPACCQAAADLQATGTDDGGAIKAAHAASATGKLYLSPGSFA